MHCIPQLLGHVSLLFLVPNFPLLIVSTKTLGSQLEYFVEVVLRMLLIVYEYGPISGEEFMQNTNAKNFILSNEISWPKLSW